MNKPDVEIMKEGSLLRSLGSKQLYIYVGRAEEKHYKRSEDIMLNLSVGKLDDYVIWSAKDSSFLVMERSALENYFQWLA